MNYERIIQNAFIHQGNNDSIVVVESGNNNEICFRKKVVYDLISFFQSRMLLYLHVCNVWFPSSVI